MTRAFVLILAILLLAACASPRDGQRHQVDPKAFQLWVVGF